MNGVFTSLDISTSGLKAQKARMEVVANNIANINTLVDRDGNNVPYRRREIYFSEVLSGNMSQKSPAGVKVSGIEEDMRDYIKKYEPGSKFADENGYVLTPNVDVSFEMVDMITASRSYEANITAIDIAKNMINNTLEIIA